MVMPLQPPSISGACQPLTRERRKLRRKLFQEENFFHFDNTMGHTPHHHFYDQLRRKYDLRIPPMIYKKGPRYFFIFLLRQFVRNVQKTTLLPPVNPFEKHEDETSANAALRDIWRILSIRLVIRYLFIFQRDTWKKEQLRFQFIAQFWDPDDNDH